MGLDPRQSLEVWEEVHAEIKEHGATPRRQRIGEGVRRVDNAVALSRLVLQTGVSDAEMVAFRQFRDADRKRTDRRLARTG